MSDLIKQITSDLQKQIEGFNPELNVTDIGAVSYTHLDVYKRQEF